MITSVSTTFSPSSRSTTRSTPCVLGCCGPMLITSSFVSNIAPRTVVSITRYPSLASSWLTDRHAAPSLDVRFFARLTQLQPVERILHQQLAWTFERVVLALRE